MSVEKNKEWTFVSGEEFERILKQADDIVEAATRGRTTMSIIAVGLAGAAMVRLAAKVMKGDLEWWFNIIRMGGDAIEKIKVPEGATFIKGPGGKQ